MTGLAGRHMAVTGALPGTGRATAIPFAARGGDGAMLNMLSV